MIQLQRTTSIENDAMAQMRATAGLPCVPRWPRLAAGRGGRAAPHRSERIAKPVPMVGTEKAKSMFDSVVVLSNCAAFMPLRCCRAAQSSHGGAHDRERGPNLLQLGATDEAGAAEAVGAASGQVRRV